MKFALVVASGVHQGKEIAVPGASLVIGRAEGCHLRPASPAISNRHCEVFARDGGMFVRDLGSTNGTLVNDAPVTGEREVKSGDRLKVGPLDFTIKVTATKSDSTPLPNALKSVPAGKTGSTGSLKSVPAAAPKPTALPKPVVLPPVTAPAAKDSSDDEMAAMLLGMDAEDPEVPGGSTIMEMPSIDAAAIVKAAAEKKVLTQADSSSAAKDLLSKYTQRPRK